jgi:hypothetical protein
MINSLAGFSLKLYKKIALTDNSLFSLLLEECFTLASVAPSSYWLLRRLHRSIPATILWDYAMELDSLSFTFTTVYFFFDSIDSVRLIE